MNIQPSPTLLLIVIITPLAARITIMLPETNLAEADIIAERIRVTIETQTIRGSESKCQVVQPSISLGLVCIENAANEPRENFRYSL